MEDEVKFSLVPDDFPRPRHRGAVTGMQPKTLVTEYRGNYYSSGCSPPEIFERWDVCEDMARQLSGKAADSKAGKRSNMSEAAILDQYLPRLVATGWVSEEEAKWVMRRVAQILCWPVPASAQAD